MFKITSFATDKSAKKEISISQDSFSNLLVVKRRKRDLNPRAAWTTYTLSRGASSASWVFLHNLNYVSTNMKLYASFRDARIIIHKHKTFVNHFFYFLQNKKPEGQDTGRWPNLRAFMIHLYSCFMLLCFSYFFLASHISFPPFTGQNIYASSSAIFASILCFTSAAISVVFISLYSS